MELRTNASDTLPDTSCSTSSDRITFGESSENNHLTPPNIQKKSHPAENKALIAEKEEPHNGLIGKWLKGSMVGLFVGLTLFGMTGCGRNTPQPPETDKPSQEQPVPGGGGFTDFTNNEEFQIKGREALTNLHDMIGRYGGDFYGKTDSGPTKDPITPQQAFDAMVKGQSFYLKGASAADPVEIKDLKAFKTVYKQVLAEIAQAEAQNQLNGLEDSLKNSETGQKALGQLQELAQKYGGNLFTKQDDGSLAPLSSAKAYQNLMKGGSIYFKGSADAEPLEVKSMRELATLYKEVLKEAAVSGVVDQGLAWIDASVKDSEKCQQILTHMSEITQKFGGNIYGKTKDGSVSKDPITSQQAYRSLIKGEGIYLRTSKNAEPIEIRNVDQLGTVYKSITKEITNSGIQMGTDWIKNGLKDSQATKDLLIQLGEMNAKYGGSFYTEVAGQKVPLSPLDASAKIASGEGFYYQSVSGAAPRQIKGAEDLISVYMEALDKLPKEEGDKEIGKTGDLLQKLIEEQLKKFMPSQPASK